MKLSVGERVRAVSLLQGYKGSIVDLRIVKEMTDSLGISEEEFKKYNVKVANGILSWDDKAGDADIEIGDRGKSIFKEILKGMEGKKELTMVDLPLWDIFVDEVGVEE